MGSLSWEALGGPWRRGVPWEVWLGGLGAVRATWETLEAAVLPGSGLGGGLCGVPYLFSYQRACLPLFALVSWCSLLVCYLVPLLVLTWHCLATALESL